jgi:hypothetical protein
MNWYIKTGIKIQREKTVTDKAYKELVELLNKYNTSLVSLKIISNWSITDQRKFIKSMLKLGYNREFLKNYKPLIKF